MPIDKLKPVRALVVDDDPDIREFISDLLESAGCEVREGVRRSIGRSGA